MAAVSDRQLQRKEAPRNYWRGRAEPVAVGRDVFRVRAFRGKGRPDLIADPLIESLSWDDTQPTLTGSVTWRAPAGRRIDLTEGHVLRLEHSTDGRRFRPLWDMRIKAPTQGLGDGSSQAELVDDLDLLNRSKDDFVYKRDKRHPRGWLYTEILEDIADRYGFEIRRMPRGRVRIKNFVKRDTSPLDAIVAAVQKEKSATHEKFRVAWRFGKLEVTLMRRSREMMLLGPAVIDASLRLAKKEGFATAITVRGTAKGRNRKRTKVERLVQSVAAVRRYGFIHLKLEAKDADTAAEAVKEARAKLASIARPSREMTITHPGLVRLRRNDAVRIHFPEVGLRAIVFAKEVRHQVTAGDYQTEITVGFADPYRDKKAERERDRRCAAARKRGRRLPADCPGARPAPKPKKAAARAERARR